MKVTLLVIGRTQNAHLIPLIEDYCHRLSHYLNFEMVEIPELRNTRNLSEQQQKTEEGKLLLARITPSSTLVLLDEHGAEMRSTAFAQHLQKRLAAGRDLVFVIGGPYGFAQEVYDRANEKISLSPMTFSHQLVRLVFTEQLYRAMTILRGEKYHHE